MKPIGPMAPRFWAKVVKGESKNDCWKWIGSKNGVGYGKLALPGRSSVSGIIYAHRYSYELHFGPIPDGLQVLHRCDNPECCNPDHLFVGTQSDNMKDANLKRRLFDVGATQRAITHCPHGHEYSKENTAIRNGRRCCKACERARSLAYYHAKKGPKS